MIETIFHSLPKAIDGFKVKKNNDDYLIVINLNAENYEEIQKQLEESCKNK